MMSDDLSHMSGHGQRTRLVHTARHPRNQHGFVNTPVYRGSTILFETMEDLLNHRASFTYARKGTPLRASLEEAWTDVSKAKGTVIVPSGLAAICLALMSCVKTGDHVLVTDSVYQPTRHFCDTVLKNIGVTTTYYNPSVGEGIAALMQPNTKVVFTESPGSLSMEIQDIPAIAKVAHAHDAFVILDNTWATPLLFSPHQHGVDLAIEAGTKYLGGGSDFMMGLVSANERSWKALRTTYDAFGMVPGPDDVFLALRGLRTLPLRLREHEKQALDMALWLQNREEVAEVLHPALPSHKGHEIWKRDFEGSSGLFSIILKPVSQKAVGAMLNGLKLFGMGYSWGGFESLVIPFDCKDFRTATHWNCECLSLRFHIGLEDLDDLKSDLSDGFKRLKQAAP